MNSDPRLPGLCAPLLVAALLLVAAAPAQTPSDPRGYTAFERENNAAMSKMMADMAVKPTGDVDIDFVAMMIPHHEGGIGMARAVLRHGRNEQLKAIARGIVAKQEQEIAAMRDSVGGHVPMAAPGKAGHMMMMR